LQEPQVGSEGGKLKIRARFSGRSAINLFGQCVGLGDSFYLTILSVPFPDGTVRLREVSVACEGYGAYVRAACLAIGRSLEKDFRHDLRAAAKRVLEDESSTNPPVYRRDVEALEVTDIRVTPDAIVLLFRLRMVVK
jgi:hypothetical protein